MITPSWLDRLFGFAYTYTIFLYVLFFIFAGMLAYHGRLILTPFRHIPKKYLVVLGGIVLLSFFFRFFVIKHGFYLVFDEYHFLNVSHNIYYHHAYGMTVQGTILHPEALKFYFRPGGHMLLLSIFYRLFGPSEQTAFACVAFLTGLLPVFVFSGAYLLLSNLRIASWSGLFAAISPFYLKYSGCMLSDLPTLTFGLLAFTLWLIYLTNRHSGLLYLLTATLLWTSYSRPEYFIALFVFCIFAFLKHPFKAKEKELWLYFVIALSMPLWIQLITIIKIENVQHGIFWNPVSFLKHLQNNVAFYFGPNSKLLYLGPLVLIGMISCGRAQKRALRILLGFFLIPFCIYSAFAAGDFPRMGLDRYALAPSWPLLILAAAGLNSCMVLLIRQRYQAAVSVCLCMTLIAIAWEVSRSQKKDFHPDSEIRFIKEICGDSLDKNIPLVTERPAILAYCCPQKVVWTKKFMENGEHPVRAYLIKTDEENEDDFEQNLRCLGYFYDMVILRQDQIHHGKTTVIMELILKETKK